MNKLSMICLGSLLLLLMAAGCRTTAYNQDRAVKQARKFLLETESARLTLQQREYIKFNKPILLVSELLPAPCFGYDQICITWQIPGIKDACMVFGFSDRQMSDWSPNRVIWRDFSPWDQNRQNAIKSARNYAINNLFFPLSVGDFNRVRFDNPQILHTGFDLADEYVGEWDEAAQSGKQKDKMQFSIVWPLGDTPGQCVIVCGRGDPDLRGWSIDFGTVIAAEELASQTLEGAPACSLDAVNFVELNGVKMVPAPTGRQE